MLTKFKTQSVLGKTYADSLESVVFSSGNWTYTRRQLVDEIGCGSFVAAARLSKVLRHLHIHTPIQLFELDPASLARTRGIGHACVFVAMCILESEKMDSIKWWTRKKNVVKFATFKHNIMTRAKKHKQAVA